MSFLFNVILTAQMLSALGVIGLVLVQHGKGADMGAAFGSGTSGSLFGATGSANFLSRATAVLATVFFACTLALAYLGTHRPSDSGSVLDRAAAPAAAAASAASGAAGQIPSGGSVPVPSTPAAPAVPASGAGQIPGR
jgi:preprotein translocase subunit SecG